MIVPAFSQPVISVVRNRTRQVRFLTAVALAAVEHRRDKNTPKNAGISFRPSAVVECQKKIPAILRLLENRTIKVLGSRLARCRSLLIDSRCSAFNFLCSYTTEVV